MAAYRCILGVSCATAFALVLAHSVLLPSRAEAAIRCAQGFQSVGGNLIATPYCQDQLVASVARSYGIKVSDREVRDNPFKKRHVCQFIGRDIRVQQACIDSFPVGRRPF